MYLLTSRDEIKSYMNFSVNGESLLGRNFTPSELIRFELDPSGSVGFLYTSVIDEKGYRVAIYLHI